MACCVVRSLVSLSCAHFYLFVKKKVGICMCFFPLPNTDFNGLAYKKGVTEFDCGACPECLRKRANVWVLRSVMEARSHVNNCMITLTYDDFVRDDSGNRVGCQELPVNPNIEVSVRHIQLFLKRLRKWYSKFNPVEKIKYLCAAEYGSRTHRAHYHLILFGVVFPDLAFYKKSKRGNSIYMSGILNNLWKFGICTIDCVHIGSAVARYCTKYCAKERSDNTFFLSSQRIGFDELVSNFNGKSYFIDGREFPIPRFIWEYYIMSKYKYLNDRFMSPRYVNRNKNIDFECDDVKYLEAKKLRVNYRFQRDKDPVYVSYLNYWRERSNIFLSTLPPVVERIKALDDKKYHNYKIAALHCYTMRRRFLPYVAPNSNCFTAYERWKTKHVGYCPRFYHLPSPSRPNTASDTALPAGFFSLPFDDSVSYKNEFASIDIVYEQLNFFDPL